MLYQTVVKRPIDLLLALFGLLILAMPFLIILIVCRLESKGSGLLKQQRYGKDKVPFACYKFRTMKVSAPSDEPTRKLKDAHLYITKSGAFLRRFGIDELPQLINIFKGEMSFIGPRPVVLAETDLIKERDKYGANALVPGIGGWAQSNGRDEVGTKDKARLDGEYAQHFGFVMDISCLWRTIIAIFSSEGFKEGHFGDTPFKHRVQKTTKKINLPKRVYSKAKAAIAERRNSKTNYRLAGK